MIGKELAFDEVILAELNNAQDSSSITSKICNIILTNKRLIVSKTGAFGKTKILFEKPLTDVKVYNGNAQVKVSTINGIQTQIDLYLTSGQFSFKLNGADNTNAIRFANELNHAVTGTEVDLYSDSSNKSGIKTFMKVFIGQTSAEAKKVINQKIAIRCNGCGATFEAIKGKTGKCPYCGSFYNT